MHIHLEFGTETCKKGESKLINTNTWENLGAGMTLVLLERKWRWSYKIFMTSHHYKCYASRVHMDGICRGKKKSHHRLIYIQTSPGYEDYNFFLMCRCRSYITMEFLLNNFYIAPFVLIPTSQVIWISSKEEKIDMWITLMQYISR